MKNMEKRKRSREFYKEKRNAVPKEVCAEKSRMICERVLSCREYEEADVLFAYYPLGKEADCREVIKKAWEDGKRVALPKTGQNRQMNFYEIADFTEVKEGRFHLMEPDQICRKAEPDFYKCEGKRVLVLVPGMAFDRSGNRYGYGMGYYDRYFETYPNLTRMALAYTEQISEELFECLPTDVKMHAIVTETYLLRMETGDFNGINRTL